MGVENRGSNRSLPPTPRKRDWWSPRLSGAIGSFLYSWLMARSAELLMASFMQLGIVISRLEQQHRFTACRSLREPSHWQRSQNQRDRTAVRQ